MKVSPRSHSNVRRASSPRVVCPHSVFSRLVFVCIAFVVWTSWSCTEKKASALDRHFSQPILREFSKQTGIEVRAKYDTESTKSVGLTNQIRAERERPKCDVSWNNEIVNTLRLKRKVFSNPSIQPRRETIPTRFRTQRTNGTDSRPVRAFSSSTRSWLRLRTCRTPSKISPIRDGKE